MKSQQVVPGLTLIRKLILDVPIDKNGWPFEMITALTTSQKLGVTSFEIDLVQAKREETEQPKVMQFLNVADFIQMIQGQHVDTWQEPPTIPGVQQVAVVRIWAVVAIDTRGLAGVQTT